MYLDCHARLILKELGRILVTFFFKLATLNSVLDLVMFLHFKIVVQKYTKVFSL